MERLIRNSIKKQLADEILFGALSKGGQVKVSTDDEGLHFDIQSLPSTELVKVN